MKQNSPESEKPKSKGGRPTLGGEKVFTPTKAQREDVAIARGGGMHPNDIALALGISVPTLNKYFKEEMTVGAGRQRLEVIKSIRKKARGGNVSAARFYLMITQRMEEPDEETGKPKKKNLGKKDQANEDAKDAQRGTGWAGILPGEPTIEPLPDLEQSEDE